MARAELELRPQWLSHWHGHITLVEPTIGSTNGAPDAHLSWDDTSLWVEFKVAEDDGSFLIRPQQRLWHRSYIKHSSDSWVVVMDKEGFWMVSARKALEEANVYKIGAKKLKWSLLTKSNRLLLPLIRDIMRRG